MFVHEEHPDADETLLFLHGGNVAGGRGTTWPRRCPITTA
jgi:hypothetical protein